MYKVSQSTKKIQVWKAFSEGATVYVEHGELNGKRQLQSYLAEPKNIGKVNETTAEEQAVLEVESLYEDRYTNKHYRYSIEDAEALANSCTEPRKIHNYKDHGHKLPDKTYSMIKLNGSRACVLNGKLLSKAGRVEEIKVPHIKEAVELLSDYSFDAEVYAHGLSLQRIRSAWLKPNKSLREVKTILAKTDEQYDPNEDASKLYLAVFDVPVQGMKFLDRMKLRGKLQVRVKELNLQDVIKFIKVETITGHEERMNRLEDVCSNGYEGLVHYSEDDVYEFGKRSYTCQKSKPRYSDEALVIDCTADKSNQGVLLLEYVNPDGKKVGFKAKMKGDAKSRAYDVQKEYINQWVTFEYEELSDSGKPTKPVVLEIRKCDSKGKPLE